MFALRAGVFTLHYFLVELPLNDSFNFFSVHRKFVHRQQQSPQKSQVNSSLLETEEKPGENLHETTKGEDVVFMPMSNDRLKQFFFRKLQSQIPEWNCIRFESQITAAATFWKQRLVYAENYCQQRTVNRGIRARHHNRYQWVAQNPFQLGEHDKTIFFQPRNTHEDRWKKLQRTSV